MRKYMIAMIITKGTIGRAGEKIGHGERAEGRSTGGLGESRCKQNRFSLSESVKTSPSAELHPDGARI